MGHTGHPKAATKRALSRYGHESPTAGRSRRRRGCCDAATDVTTRAARANQLAPPSGTRRRPRAQGRSATRAAHRWARRTRQVVARDVCVIGIILYFLQRCKHSRKIAHTAYYSLNNRRHILHISRSLQSELASMCQSSFIVVKQAKNGQWRMLTYTEGI